MSTCPKEIYREALGYTDIITEWRRRIHRHPEVGYHLPHTAAMVESLLKSFGFEVQTGFAESAVLGTFRTGRPGKTIAVRADMDALGMQEQSGLPFASEIDGVCHACGHDAHTAMLLGLAKYIHDHPGQFSGTIKLIFQPAEEGPAPGGAKLVVDSGILDGIDAIFGAHSQPLYEAGHIGCKFGDAFASGDFFEAKITGQGCHAASPHRGKDVITTAMEIINAIQLIRSRELPPLKTGVISVCSINAGKLATKNVLPNEVTFGGTFRAYDDAVRDYIAKRIEQIIHDICALNGCTYEYTDTFAFPAFSNDDDVLSTIFRSAQEVLGEDKVIRKPDPEMGSEDFAHYTKKYKGAFFFFGIRNDDAGCNYSLHNPRFNIDESTFGPTLAVYVNTLINLLNQ